MRLGQLARKYNINQEEVISFLNEIQPEMGPFHHNSKLSPDSEDLVINQFSLIANDTEEAPEVQHEAPPVDADEQSPDSKEVDEDSKVEADLQRELDPSLPAIEPSAFENKEDNSIASDRLLELLEADEVPDDLSKITHIKAPKKELSGLKVVGKIDLPEPKSKPIDKNENEDKEEPEAAKKTKRKGHRQISEEEKEERRLKAKAKKEQYEARQEKRRLEREKKRRKALNKARYEEKVRKAKAARAKQQKRKEVVEPEVNTQPQAAEPKTILGKFWRWFNT